ncbi:twin-arginine translocation signal domain-containing protein [Streptomyces sp. NBC_00102]|uniref:twin-arginine translocation signal domain-containing protein n=1 Tax=Streptomyces sp. NBC_00102 TaxID=2975652 RepID=UPI00224E23DF|nr:twin-arginine translocation signal domain-containing protein [Streptomyces sp. NBC_00102]MCX5395468.1 twin-arginine translocation signal domain-containing protein [Streptomyces sp. NBC_00102]
MSSISRRTLLGYSGTAAGAALGGIASAQPAEAAEAPAAQATQATQAEASTTTAAEFAPGTLFDGLTRTPFNADGEWGELRIKFSVEHAETPVAHVVSPLELAQLLNDFAATKGWPAMTFYGTPVAAPLN